MTSSTPDCRPRKWGYCSPFVDEETEAQGSALAETTPLIHGRAGIQSQACLPVSSPAEMLPGLVADCRLDMVSGGIEPACTGSWKLIVHVCRLQGQ